MKVLVDTCVWSMALRKNTSRNDEVVSKLTQLIEEVRVQIIGPIRQELLSGIKSKKHFEELKYYLSSFPDIPLKSNDYEKAAELFNTCRKNGIQGSNTDFLICSVAINHDFEIFTTDNDFNNFKKCIPIKSYQM